MALLKTKDKNNEKEAQNLHPAKPAGKLPLDDDLLGSVSGGDGSPGFDRNPNSDLIPVLGTTKF